MFQEHTQCILLAEGQFDILEPHTLTGQIALWLMLFHAIWATRVVVKQDELMKNQIS